jgi:hypothetical protein
MWVRFFSLWLLLSAGILSGASIKTAFTRHYDSHQIRALGDYFGEQSNRQGFRTLFVSDPENPAGQYFILQLSGDLPKVPTKFLIEVLRSDRKIVESVRLDGGIALESDWIYLGLTGINWPDDTVQPVAWRVSIIDANDQLLASWKSFLWEKP